MSVKSSWVADTAKFIKANPGSGIAFCCSDCKKERERRFIDHTDGQIMGFLLKDKDTWIWMPAKMPPRPTTLTQERRIAMNCTLSRHAVRSKLSTWMISRAQKSMRAGYQVLHL